SVDAGLVTSMRVISVVVSTHIDVAVFLEGIRIKTAEFNGQRVVVEQLGLYHRVNLGRVTAFGSDGVTQTSQIDQCGLPQNVVAHHTGRIPGEIQVALAFDQLG